MMQVFNTCEHFIRITPTLVYDDKHVEDVDTSLEDHEYDAARYAAMEYIITPRLPAKVEPKQVDPFDRRTAVFR